MNNYFTLPLLALCILSPALSLANCTHHVCGENPKVQWDCDFAFSNALLTANGKTWSLYINTSGEKTDGVLTAGALYKVVIANDLGLATFFKHNELIGPIEIAQAECKFN